MILIAALILAVLVWVVERPDQNDGSNFSAFVLLPELEGQDVRMVEVKHLINGSRLEKVGDGWQVSDLETEMGKQIQKKDELGVAVDAPNLKKRFRADSERVERIIERLKVVEAKSLISNNPEKQNIYQIGPLAKSITLYGSDGKVLTTLLVGKNGPEVFANYVRRDGENEVYLVGEQVGAMAPADVMSWRDKEIWDVEPANLESVTVTKGQESFTIARAGDEGWTLTSPEKVMLDSKKVSDFFEKIFPLKAARFAYVVDRAETALDQPEITVSFIAKNAAGETVRVGGQDKQGYIYAEVDGKKDEIYLLESTFPSKIPSHWDGLKPDVKSDKK